MTWQGDIETEETEEILIEVTLSIEETESF